VFQGRRKVGRVDMTHGMKDISPYLGIFPVKTLEKSSDLPAFAVLSGRAGILNDGQAQTVAQTLHLGPRYQGKGTDDRHFAVKEGLFGQHGRHLAPVTDVDKKVSMRSS